MHLQCVDGTACHRVAVGYHQFDHVAVVLVIAGQVGQHVVLRRLAGPRSGQVELERVDARGIEVGKGWVPMCQKNGVGIFDGVLGAIDGLDVCRLALEEGVGDAAVTIEVDLVVVAHEVFADHLSLEVARLGGVSAHEGNVFVVVEDDSLIALLLDGTVEEHDGNARLFRLLADDVAPLRTSAVDDVDHQNVRPISDGLVDLGVLGHLVMIGIVLLVGDLMRGEVGGEGVADRADVHVIVVVVEDGGREDGALRAS